MRYEGKNIREEKLVVSKSQARPFLPIVSPDLDHFLGKRDVERGV